MKLAANPRPVRDIPSFPRISSRVVAFFVALVATTALGVPTAVAGTGSMVGGVLTFGASAGETNNVTISWSQVGGFAHYVSDTGAPVVPGAGCTTVTANSVRCADTGTTSMTISLSDGNDRLDFACTGVPVTAHGSDGNDTLFGSLANDRLEGDAGGDTLRGGPSNGCLTPVENEFQTPTDGNDLTFGGSGSDSIYGGAGSDIHDGGPDDDVLAGVLSRLAEETLRGGEGNDTLTDYRFGHNTDFSGGPGNDSITASSQCPGSSCTASTMRLVEAADANLVLTDTSLTGLGTDVLGGLNAASLEGGVSQNTLDASAFSGPVALSGGWSIDTLRGGSANDVLSGGPFGDDLSGGGGSDTVDYTAHDDAGVTVTFDDVANDGAVTTDWNGDQPNRPMDNVRSDIENAIGTDGPDQFLGTASANRLVGRGGIDTLSGAFGNDVLIGGGHGDDLSGGGGSDTVDYSGHAAGVNVTMDDVANDGAAGTDWNGGLGRERPMDNVRSDVENVVGSNSADHLTGSASANHFEGRDGADMVSSGPGNDVLHGGEGNDLMAGGSGSDYYEGGNGFDNRFVEAADADSTFTGCCFLDTGTDHDQLDSMHRGTLLGGPGDNTIDASSATFVFLTLDGGAGNDTLKGGGGPDILLAGAGNDSLTGGGGSDQVVAAGDVDFTLTSTTLVGEGSDTLATIEHAAITAGPSNNTLNAAQFAGFVTMDAGAGDDLLTGPAGSGRLNGGAGTDRLVESADVDFTLTDTGLAGVGEDELTSIERATLTGGLGSNAIDASAFSGSVTLDGRGAGDLIRGGSGDDVLTGAGGGDELHGGGGIDAVREAADANFILTNTSLSGNGTDALSGIERAELNGGSGNNALDAGAFTGAAALDGAEGNDNLTGGAGDDSLVGGGGSDTFAGGDGNDSIASRDAIAREEVACGLGPADVAAVDPGDVVGADCEQVDFGAQTLTVRTAGSGSGLVTSDPRGIDCGEDCSEGFAYGDNVLLTARSDSASTFTGWSGACRGTGECTVQMSEAKSVTASFVLVTRTLTVSKAGPGSGSVGSSPAGIDCGADCSEGYVDGTSVTLTPTPSATSTFSGWSGACTGTGACVVTMDAAKSATATFALVTRTLTVSKSGTGTGLANSSPAGIDCGADCSEGYDHGTSVTLTATPNANSTFTGWSGACSGTGACVVTMDGARSITAAFDAAPTPPPPPPDTVAPDTTIKSGPSRTTRARLAKLAFTSTEAGSRFQCKLDKAAWRSCASPKTYKKLKKGPHAFQVRAIDAAGNVDASPAKRAWRIR